MRLALRPAPYPVTTLLRPLPRSCGTAPDTGRSIYVLLFAASTLIFPEMDPYLKKFFFTLAAIVTLQIPEKKKESCHGI
jgi:hypothetical protein